MLARLHTYPYVSMSPSKRPDIIVISDGKDHASHNSPKDLCGHVLLSYR